MIPTRRRRLRLSILATAGLAIALVGSPTLVAAGSPATVAVGLANPCVEGVDFIKGATVTLTLKRGGAVAARSSFKTTSQSFTRCLAKALKGGDTLVMKQVKNGVTSLDRSLPIPVMPVTLDAATDVIRGSVTIDGTPAEGDPVLLQLYAATGIREDQGPGYSETVGIDGQVEIDATPDIDIGPATTGMLQWYPMTGDTVRSNTALPAAAMFTGTSAVKVTGKPGSKTTVTLKTSGGTIRGTATITTKMVDGTPVGLGAFKSGSTAVKPKVGDRITSSRLPGSWTVLANTLSVTPGSGDGAAGLTCPENVDAALWIDGGIAGSGFFPTGGVSFSGLFIASGAEVELVCQDANGFSQWFRKVVP